MYLRSFPLKRNILLVISLAFLVVQNAQPVDGISIFDYLQPQRFLPTYFSNYFNNAGQTNRNAIDDEELPTILYESNVRDEKFIRNAAALIGSNLSELDVCHHRVLLSLKKKCHQLNSEELAKLSVQLYNCQLNAEGRSIFQCTDAMTLKDCTQHMGEEQLATYNVMINRAKAICMLIRQEHFRGLAEMTVNRLLETAKEQINTMSKLNEYQENIQKISTESMGELKENNQLIGDQQKEMFRNLDDQRQTIQENLDNLLKENDLIKTVQSDLSQLITEVKDKLGSMKQNLNSQSSEWDENSAKMINTLSKLHDNLDKMSEQFYESTAIILKQAEMAKDQLDGTKKQLIDINETIHNLSELIRYMQNNLDKKFNWFLENVGGTEAVLNNVTTGISYLGFMLFGMIILTFLNADNFSRTIFAAAVPINCLLTFFDFYYLDMKYFAIFLLTLLLGIMVFKKFPSNFKIGNMFQMVDNEEGENVVHQNGGGGVGVMDNESVTHNSTTHNYKHSQYNSFSPPISTTPLMQRFLNSSYDTQSTRSGTPFSESLFNRKRCAANTLRGEQCRNATTVGNDFCRIHNRKYQ